MPITIVDRLIHAWNAFRDRDPTTVYGYDLGSSYSRRPDRFRLSYGNEKSIISSVYTRIAIDVSTNNIQHVRLDQNGRYLETINSGLNECLTIKANADQTGRELIRDIVLSMFDEGCVAVVPVETTLNPNISGSWDIQSLRTGKVVEWFPQHVRVSVYNELRGEKEEITLAKKDVAIIENPLYAVMNEPNSTLQRLISKLNMLDAVDKASSSGKLDVVIQLPYVVKTALRKKEAEQRRQDIVDQLTNTPYGVAYVDGTERITQLNRPAENNLMKQVEYLTNMLYGQLGMTPAIFDGTADEKVMLGYYNRTVEPIVCAITEGMRCKFITKTARTQGQSIAYFRNPFSFVTAEVMATLSDSFTRNAIASSNEIRAVVGWKPSKDPAADELRNKNLNPPAEQEKTKDAPSNPEKSINNEKGVDKDASNE